MRSRSVLLCLLLTPGGLPAAPSDISRAEAGWREIQVRWPVSESQAHQEARRLELIVLLHRLRRDSSGDDGEGDPGVRRVAGLLDQIEEDYCDRRDPERAARHLRLPVDRLRELELHLQRHHEARQRGEDPGDIDLFRGVEICRYR